MESQPEIVSGSIPVTSATAMIQSIIQQKLIERRGPNRHTRRAMTAIARDQGQKDRDGRKLEVGQVVEILSGAHSGAQGVVKYVFPKRVSVMVPGTDRRGDCAIVEGKYLVIGGDA